MTGPASGENSTERDIRAKVRLDFKGVGRPGRLFFGGKSTEKAAEEMREQQAAMLRNIPVQGIHILDVDLSLELYTIYDDVNNQEVAYAPAVLELIADTIEDLVRFAVREEFRKIEIISPAAISLQKVELERLMFRVAEEVRKYRQNLERKYNIK
ncbi:hypothetical protein GFC01_04950 [Desulfofundulus thermobenzoicus]|uniref:Uncharacterized protein n=1 Tax=Desulfofundulus thermobenzoicus TaxID=29376 RepID=A0A6N7IR43_9FIRM|nr:hypothetical protein [Desulfofundulus thermobenzoicus]MQL51618.1 hypothetical protein [Desulfofundulus thermobenzoicus]